MTLAQHRSVTEAEFLALPESMNRVELIDGEVVMAPAPSLWHQEILVRLVEVLRTWARQHPGPVTVGQSPVDIRFGPGRILQPDAFVLFERIAREHTGPLDHVPALCIEVLSTNRVYDRVTKRYVYAEAGVRELWLVDPAGHIERRFGPGLERAEMHAERLETPRLPGLSVDVASLLADPG